MLVSHKIGHRTTAIAALAFAFGCSANAGSDGPNVNDAPSGGGPPIGGASAGGSKSSGGAGGTKSGGTGGTKSGGTGGTMPLEPDAGEKPECELIESFDDGAWPHLPWVPEGGGKSSTGTLAAHDGSAGLLESEWMIDQFVSVGAPGERLSAWVSGDGGGRAYLGFGPTPKGTKALVFAPNAHTLILNDIPGFYTFEDVETAQIPLSVGAWYKLEIEFGSGGSVTGRLYESDGASLVATVTHTFSDF